MRSKRIVLPLVLAEAIVGLAIVVAGAWLDRSGRVSGPEAPLSAYASAVASQDLTTALDQIEPSLRSGAEPFVAWQLGNQYTFQESVVRAPSPLDRVLGNPGRGVTVVTVIEVQNEDGSRWQAVEDVAVIRMDGRWYLLKAPLEP